MWEGGGAPLYSLPGCRSTIPLASVSMRPQQRESFSLELLASTRELPQPEHPPSTAPFDSISARATLTRAALAAGIDTGALRVENFILHSVRTGATEGPTTVASYLESVARGAERGSRPSSHVLVVSDSSDTGRVQTYLHVASGDAESEFRRFIDRIDLDGDGVDELLLEGWRLSGETYPLILKWSGNQWQEVFRGRDSWCLDRRRR
jgi:hypothetical protein